jgi:class 3 adenylate cyclase
VIGPAVNLAAGLERLCRELGVDLALSDAFARLCAAVEYHIGPQDQLPGTGRPVEMFTTFERA